MCVLASAVDIYLLTHHEAVTGYPAGHRLASFLSPWLLGRTSYATHCVRAIREGWGSLYIIYSSCETGDLEGNLFLLPLLQRNSRREVLDEAYNVHDVHDDDDADDVCVGLVTSVLRIVESPRYYVSPLQSIIAAGFAFIAPPHLLPITIHPTNNDEDNEQERIYPGPPPRFRSHCKLRLHCSAPLSGECLRF